MGFGVLRALNACAHASPNEMLGKQSRWHRLSNLALTDEYDRPSPVVTVEDRAVATKSQF